MTQERKNLHIVIAGAGPSGMLLATFLGKQGIKTTLVEQTNDIDQQPRATHYGSPAVHELLRAGVLDDIRAEGFIINGVSWRKMDTSVIAKISNEVMYDHPEALTCLPLDRVLPIFKKHAMACPSVTFKFNHKVIGLGQDDTSAWVECQLADGTTTTVKGDYVVGCDGANSIIRKSLFGSDFPGFTWDEQVVATNVRGLDFEAYGIDDSTFIIHPEHWYMAARISNDGLWRVSYGERGYHTREELIERQPMKYELMLPMHPKPGTYTITNVGPYRVHQRCAKSMRVGRVLLAADSAHLCNPFGGMGLTGGIVDIGNLYDCLYGIEIGELDDSILDKYDQVRRDIYQNVINVISSANIRRLFGQDPETAGEKDEFLKELKEITAKGPEAEKEWALRSYAIQHDFTQYYKSKQTAAAA